MLFSLTESAEHKMDPLSFMRKYRFLTSPLITLLPSLHVNSEKRLTSIYVINGHARIFSCGCEQIVNGGRDVYGFIHSDT